MIGFIIIILLLIVLILWGRWEIKHAITMPEDFDEETQRLINEQNNHDNFNNPAV